MSIELTILPSEVCENSLQTPGGHRAFVRSGPKRKTRLT